MYIAGRAEPEHSVSGLNMVRYTSSTVTLPINEYELRLGLFNHIFNHKI